MHTAARRNPKIRKENENADIHEIHNPRLEKCFLDEKIDSKKEIKSISMLRNERLSFEFAYTTDGYSPKAYCDLKLENPFGENLKLFKIEQVPVFMPAYPGGYDDNYLRTEPGLYPDLLLPLDEKLPFVVVYNQLRSVLVTIEDTDGLKPGDYTLKISVACGNEVSESSIDIRVVDAMLPEQKLIHTQWFHNDCIATYIMTARSSPRVTGS